MVGFLSSDSEWVCSYRVGFIPALNHEAFALTFRNRRELLDVNGKMRVNGTFIRAIGDRCGGGSLSPKIGDFRDHENLRFSNDSLREGA